ncbi:hypothetical protein MHK_002460 [Candidatus Magnetomorum sp. HK-1]|nr:hypothetical protein MHK_002460 [Candidatus Magnetomorum sp. HK-1]
MKKLFEVKKLQNELPYEVWSVEEPVPEIYADGTEGLMIHDGIVKFNLYSSVIERDESARESMIKKVITQRVVMPMPKFFELMNRGVHVQNMIKQQQEQQQFSAEKPTLQ